MTSNSHKLLAKGLVERIGQHEGVLKHRPTGKDTFELIQEVPDHTAGINMILDALTDPVHGVLENLSELNAVGHRVAHGGEYFNDSAIVNAEVKKKIESCFELAPLHNPAHMKGIQAIEHILPTIPQVVTFDTSFHQSIPAYNYLYAIPYKYYTDYGVRKYGFHGTSHRFVGMRGCEMTGLDFSKSKVITCHIGNGASITAIVNGKSYDTSMGFTPADGLIMGTRCGEIDPGALIYIGEKSGKTYERMNEFINKKCGVEGFTGISSDMRDIENAAAEGNERARLILDMYFERIKRFIGGYAAQMGGVDLIVFTGGVGENQWPMREAVCEGLEFMGVEFDRAANHGVKGQDKILSMPDSKVKVVVASTDEELVIASDTFRLLKKRSE